MLKQLDLYRLYATIGRDNFIKLVESGQVTKDELNRIDYDYKLANRDTYSITIKSVNDGNNAFEDVVYYDVKKPFNASHSHTMSDNIEWTQCNDIERLNMILKGLKYVYIMRDQFGFNVKILSDLILCVEDYISELNK